MKKLMIALAAVAVGCMASASTVSWGFSEVVDEKGNLITADPGYAGNIVLAVMGDSGWEKFADNTGIVIDDGVAMYAEDTTKSYTEFAGKQFTMMLEDESGNLSKIKMYAGGTYDTVLSVKEDIGSNWKDMETLYSDSAMVVSVPEPTSGLLLLLGVAGLALRRRRA